MPRASRSPSRKVSSYTASLIIGAGRAVRRPPDRSGHMVARKIQGRNSELSNKGGQLYRRLGLLPVRPSIFGGALAGNFLEYSAEVLRVPVARLFPDVVELEVGAHQKLLRLLHAKVTDEGAEGRARLSMELGAQVLGSHV